MNRYRCFTVDSVIAEGPGMREEDWRNREQALLQYLGFSPADSAHTSLSIFLEG